jgi:hypothetical protein
MSGTLVRARRRGRASEVTGTMHVRRGWTATVIGAALGCAAATAGAGMAAAPAWAGGCYPSGATISGLVLLAGQTLCGLGTLTNIGTITVASGSATIDVPDLVNRGTVSAPANTSLKLDYPPVNLKGTTLTGGTWVAAGTLQMTEAFSNLTTITSAATFHLNNRMDLTTGSVTSSGRIILGTAGDSGDSVNWWYSGSFTMTGGSFTFLDPNACINIGSGPFRITGGTMSGYGMLTGTVTVSGSAVFSPTLGGPAAQFSLNGSYTQTGGTFEDNVTESGGAGELNPSSTRLDGGTLLIESAGPRPSSAQHFTIINGAVSGSFSAVHNMGTASFSASYGSSGAVITAGSTWPPAAPRIGKAAADGTGGATVSWSPPASNGSPKVTAYVVTPHPACACSGLSAGGTATTTTVSGLSAGTPYTFTVQAVNSAGTGVPSAPSNAVSPVATEGFWLAASDGSVFGAGSAVGAGGVAAPATNPVVGIAASATSGYYLVQRDGAVTARGGARSFGDLPSRHVGASDIVAIAPTYDGGGYWLVGADGGEFAFGDARYHGSLPQLGVRVRDVVGMVATPNGSGYLLVGADGGVFAFGARYHGSLPALGVHVADIVGILPAGGEGGYVLVGADGGAFVFGRGSGYHGSLPGENVVVDDIVGLALTRGGGGYWMAGSDGSVYAFGNAQRIATPAGVSQHLPVAGIAA